MKTYLEKIEHDLKERLKELECLYSIGSELESGRPLDVILTDSTRSLKKAFQFPDHTFPVIHVHGVDYCSESLPDTGIRHTMSVDIVSGSTVHGFIRVGSSHEKDFLIEEDRLITEIARMIAKVLDRHALQEELKKYIGRLEEMVSEKTAELETSQKRWEDLFEYAPAGVVISTLEGDIVKANRTFYRMLSYPEDGSVHLNFVTDNLYKDIPHIRPHVFQKLDENGFLEGLEMTLLDRNGNSCPVIASFIYIDIDGKRCVEEVYKDIRFLKEIERKLIEQNENLESIVARRTEDIEQKRLQLMQKNEELTTLTEELVESRANLQTLFDAITDTVIMIDPEWNIQMTNKPAFGTNGKCYQKVFHRESLCPGCPTKVVFRDKRPHSLEQKIDDEYYRCLAYPILDARNEIEGAIEIIRETTTQHNMEYQLMQADKLASLGQLVSGVAHEINNPNTFIRGNITIIREALKDVLPVLDAHSSKNPDFKVARLRYDVFKENIPVLIDDMEQGTSRIKGIVDGLREFARRDDGILNDAVDLNIAVENCLRLVQNQVKRNAKVTFESARNLPTFKGNFQKIEQVIINMIINASHAIEKEKGAILISTAHVPDTNEVLVRISDTGIGMDEKTRNLIFDPFFTTKRHRGGTGLGLSIAHRIIREHKGRIDVDSTQGVGTTFTIYIPVAPKESA